MARRSTGTIKCGDRWISPKEDRTPVTSLHPEEHLAEELIELGMSPAELARNVNMPANRITAILHGSRAITGDTALLPANFFGTSPEFWLNLQSRHELRLAQQKAGRSIRTLPKLKRT